MPAIKELKGSSDGEEAGRVFHEFATFCDQQLQNVDGLEDFTRIEQLRDRKEEELNDLERMMKAAEGKERDQLKVHRVKTKQWFDLDDREYQRLKRSRESFLQQCLENYLLCLKACDTYKNDALRFCALWLDKSGSDIANSAVSKHIDQVPSRKFVPLMNQLSSRLLDTSDTFQSLLNSVVFRICVDHPYHGMYQIFASSKSKGGKDQTAMARHQAANKLVDKIKASRKASSTWVALHNSNIVFVRFAGERLDEKVKQGAKVNLAKSVWGKRLEQDATNQKIPPPTMTVDLRPDCDYSRVPRIVKFQSEFTVASGISAPKIVTALASDGLKYKQLVSLFQRILLHFSYLGFEANSSFSSKEVMTICGKTLSWSKSSSKLATSSRITGRLDNATLALGRTKYFLSLQTPGSLSSSRIPFRCMNILFPLTKDITLRT